MRPSCLCDQLSKGRFATGVYNDLRGQLIRAIVGDGRQLRACPSRWLRVEAGVHPDVGGVVIHVHAL